MAKMGEALGEAREAVKLLLKRMERMTKEMTEKNRMKLKSSSRKKKALDSNVRILHLL